MISKKKEERLKETMLNISRANLISKMIFTMCVLITTTTVCLLIYGFIRSNHHITNDHHQQSHNTKVTPSGLVELIANVTQTIAVMEAEAQRLKEELQRMRQTTRQLLSKHRKDALWTAIHKCVFFHGCSKRNYIPRTTGKGANKTPSHHETHASSHLQ
jgi:hypothetical protein